MKILLVEDDLSLINGLSFAVKKQGYELDIARTSLEADAQWADGKYDLIILDVSLPDGSGFDLCRKMRQTSKVPIIFLTAADEETDIIMGLDIGGDDYITKPFKLAVLLSRINALLRRSNQFNKEDGELHSNGITVQRLRGKVYKNGEELELTASEYKLLCFFMENSEIVLSAEQILGKLWDCDENYVDGNTLTVYIRRLRTKIEDDPGRPERIVTVRGMGYKWRDGGVWEMRIFADKRIKALFQKILFSMAAYTVVSVGAVFAGSRYYFDNKTAPAFTAYFILGCALCMILTVVVILGGYFREQNRILEEAAAQVREYMAGNRDARIACHEEGELYRLFHEVNSLAAVMNAHTEKERQEKQFLKDTISDISHQLKTPLAALNIYNGILQGEAEGQPTIQEFTALSEQELDRIETLVQNLLKITKLDAGAIMMDKQPENMAEMMEAVRKHFAFRAECEGKEICLSGGQEIMLSCDRLWLTEAVDNIVKNALDHTKEGGLVQISWKESASAVRLTVKDNGSGIHPEDLYHIFKRFYRSRFSKDTQGIGLGLPLAKSIIEAHNGTIEVDSVEGRGTTFIITFPDKIVG